MNGHSDDSILLCVSVAQSCLTLCASMDCSLLGSSVHGILQARILEWVDISCPRGGYSYFLLKRNIELGSVQVLNIWGFKKYTVFKMPL